MTLAVLDNSAAIIRIALVLATLMAVCIICLMVALWMRKWVKDSDPPVQHVGFSLSDLRQMHRSGHLTTEEFERAKQKIVAAATRNLPNSIKAKPTPTDLPPLPSDGGESEGGGGAG